MKIFKYLVLLMFFGGITLFVVGILSGADLRNIIATYKDDDDYTQQDQVVFDEAITAIDIDTDIRNILISASDDQNITIDYYTKTHEIWQVEIIDGVLVIEQETENQIYNWWNFTFTSAGLKDVIIHIPFQYVTALDVNTSTGNIEVSGLEFSEVDLETNTGNIDVSLMVSNEASFKTDTGNIQLNDVYILNDVLVNTDTGEAIIKDIEAQKLEVNIDTGLIDIDGINVLMIELETDTGSIHVKDIDLTERTVKVYGNFITNVFINDTLVSDTYQVIYDDETSYYIHVSTDTGSIYINED